MTKHLFLFTITPVQSFVMQARKAQDFHAGSRILSGLTKSALEEARNISKNCEVVFPNENIESMPNRFMAIVESDNIKKFGENLKEHVEDKFKKIMDDSLSKFLKPKNYEEQIKNHLFITWAAMPFDRNKDVYAKKYKEVEALLGGAKNIRMFQQSDDSETGRKCSLCGERNALFVYDKGKFYTQDDAVDIKNVSPYLLNRNEGLCGICAGKRFYGPTQSFDSTADIALLHTFEKLQSLKFVLPGKYDPQAILIPLNESDKDGYTNEDLSDSGEVANAKKIRDYIDEHNKIHKENKILMTPYYALMAFDGDSMGETLGGKNLKDGVKLIDFQKALSEKLGAFAENVKNIVEKKTEKRGRVVFAGGEDFLGFVNLNYLLSTMKDLREKFDDDVNEPLKKYLKDGEKLSFSAGVVIAHFKMPLSTVIKMTREMEKLAKQRDGKDAFSVAVMKHSGEINSCTLPWNFKGSSMCDSISFLVNKMQEEKLSNTFIKVLETEFTPIIDRKGRSDVRSFEPMLMVEMERTLARAIHDEKTKIKDLTEKITKSLKAIVDASKEGTYINTNNFFSTLHIVDFLHRKTGEA